MKALLIHGVTGKPVEYHELTEKQIAEAIDEGKSATGKRYLLVNGYRYEVDAPEKEVK